MELLVLSVAGEEIEAIMAMIGKAKALLMRALPLRMKVSLRQEQTYQVTVQQKELQIEWLE
jgi:hypothetical protein